MDNEAYSRAFFFFYMKSILAAPSHYLEFDQSRHQAKQASLAKRYRNKKFSIHLRWP